MKRIVLLAMLATLACKGSEGPVGPAGLQGAPGTPGTPGAPGPGTRLQVDGTMSSAGVALIALPAIAGSMSKLPAVSCYLLSVNGSDSYWVAAGDSAFPGSRCQVYGKSDDTLEIRFVAPPATKYSVVVVY